MLCEDGRAQTIEKNIFEVPMAHGHFAEDKQAQ